MGGFQGGDHKVVVIHGDDLGNLAGLVVEGPTGHLAGILDGTEIVSAFQHAVDRVGIDTQGVASLAIVLILAGGSRSEVVGLAVEGIEGFLAGEGLFLVDGHLLLHDRSGLAGHLDDMGTVLGLQDIRLTNLSGDHGLHALDHIGLGHPAQVTHLATVGRTLIGGVKGSQVGEGLLLALEDSHQAVGHVVGVRTLEEDMADVDGIGNVLGVHYLGQVEGVAGSDDIGSRSVAFPDIALDGRSDAGELALLVPVLGIRALGAVLHQEVLHVVGSDELIVQGGDGSPGSLDVFGGRNDLEHDILDIAAGLLAEEFLVIVVEVTDFAVGNRDGGILLEAERHHDEVHVGGIVVLSDIAAEHQWIDGIAGNEQRSIFVKILLIVDGVLQVIPIQADVLVRLGSLGEIGDLGRGELAILIEEHLILRNQRGSAGKQALHFFLANVQAGGLCLLNEEEAVDQVLPGGVTDLLLGIGVAVAGSQVIDRRETADLLLEIGIGDGISVDFADIIA